ncbi:hypothetical protein EDD80_102145 [Anseongella ginsenosidimutans]|uniref:Uncharacterized protein n=1 Tax=Anseongella ginsenosidimutans TaxID=496056 RepID=A0A4R3KVJ9_9SPHI|nr:hypothetical protein EDD80_102145 [Anseongella ginsenosidimutans]
MPGFFFIPDLSPSLSFEEKDNANGEDKAGKSDYGHNNIRWSGDFKQQIHHDFII